MERGHRYTGFKGRGTRSLSNSAEGHEGREEMNYSQLLLGVIEMRGRVTDLSNFAGVC